MVTKEEIEEAFDKVTTQHVARIGDPMMGLFLQPLDFGRNLHMSTLVYIGDKFIPESVRKRAILPIDIKQSFPTRLVFEEELFQISLHYMGNFTTATSLDLYELASEFEETALRWRQIFDEKDRQDLIHVHNK